MLGLAGVYACGSPDGMRQRLEQMSEVLQHRGMRRTHEFSFTDGYRTLVACHVMHGEGFIISSRTDGVLVVDGVQRHDEGAEELIEALHPGAVFVPDLVGEISRIGAVSESLVLSLGEAGLCATRFPFSMRPLYLHLDDESLLFASERKCLWTIGIDEISALQPGEVCKVHPKRGFQLNSLGERLPPQLDRRASRELVIDSLGQRLRASLERIRGRDAAVLFSGGVDSSLAAKLAQEVCGNVVLYTTRTEDSHDKRVAEMSAESLGIKLVQVDMPPDTVWEAVPSVIWAIESSSVMDIEIALPFFLAARQAAYDGLELIVSGQGPDELFAGYARHLRVFEEKGAMALNEQLWKEVSVTHEVNIERDERAIAFHELEAFFPYLNPGFMELALAAPGEWKIKPESNPSRKILFRELAQVLGLPREIALLPKRATQYSSGSSKVLQDAISRNVKGASDLGRKGIRALAQTVLDRFAHEMGMPVETQTTEIEFKTEPTWP
ncbi:MAG: asparagine synthetase B [Candidatus Thorarchaeota archaeon]|nr:MAG: asparagine synthetase B [Candidatus Thorarchaeota archaeon]